jgi:hypothetical protein
LLPENDSEEKVANFDQGIGENFENRNWDSEKGLGEAEMERLGPERDKCLLNASERDGAENGPLDWAEIFIEEFGDEVEDEDGES